MNNAEQKIRNLIDDIISAHDNMLAYQGKAPGHLAKLKVLQGRINIAVSEILDLIKGKESSGGEW